MVVFVIFSCSLISLEKEFAKPLTQPFWKPCLRDWGLDVYTDRRQGLRPDQGAELSAASLETAPSEGIRTLPTRLVCLGQSKFASGVIIISAPLTLRSGSIFLINLCVDAIL